MSRRGTYAAGVGLAALAAASPAGARVEISPQAELRQVVSLQDPGNTDMFAEAALGFTATIERPRVQGNMTYRFGQRFEQSGDVSRDQTHQFLGRVGAEVIRRTLTVEVGGFAALLNQDLAGNVSFSPDVDNSNLVQTYSAYVEPRLYREIGDFAEFDASYRAGIFEVGDQQRTPGSMGGSGNRFAIASDSVNQRLNLQLGNRERSERLRWELIGTGIHDDAERLDQSYRSYEGRAEVELVISRGFSLLGTGGYEDISSRERDVVRDPTGIPVIGPDGDFVLDPSGRKRAVYEQSDPILLGGFRLQPTRRTFIQVQAGQRFGDFNITGEARFQPNERFVVSASLNESIDTNGRVLTQDLSSLGRGIVSTVVNNQDILGTSGCVFGVDPGTGGCLFSATQSLSSALFRNQTAQMTAEYRMTRTRAGVSLVYSRRRFLDLQQIQTPGAPAVDPSLTSRTDQTIGLNARVSRELRRGSSMSFGTFVNRYRFALLDSRNEYFVGAFSNYSIAVDRRLRAQASFNVAKRFSNVIRDSTQAVLSAGVTYQF